MSISEMSFRATAAKRSGAVQRSSGPGLARAIAAIADYVTAIVQSRFYRLAKTVPPEDLLGGLHTHVEAALRNNQMVDEYVDYLGQVKPGVLEHFRNRSSGRMSKQRPQQYRDRIIQSSSAGQWISNAELLALLDDLDDLDDCTCRS